MLKLKNNFIHIANSCHCYIISNLDKLTEVWNNALIFFHSSPDTYIYQATTE